MSGLSDSLWWVLQPTALRQTMKTTSQPSLIYARFLNLAAAVRGLTEPSALDPAEDRMLQALTVAWSKGQPVTVLEAMALPHGLSQSTAHRRLTSLRKKGLLSLRGDERDARVRYVEATDKTQRILHQLGGCIIEASREASS